MHLLSDSCICLRKVEYSETSQILTLLSHDHGIVKVVAKGAHRRTKAGAGKFDGGIDLLDSGQAVFIAGNNAESLATLTEWKLREGHLGLRANLRGLYLAMYAVELICLLFEERDPHPEIFDRLELVLIDLATDRREESFLAFELDLLRIAGFMPQLSACVSCGSRLQDRQSIYFAPSRGGVVCRNCRATFPRRLELDARLFRLLQSMPSPAGPVAARRLPRLSRHQTDPLNRLLAGHIEYALGRRPRMAYYILGRRGTAPPDGYGASLVTTQSQP